MERAARLIKNSKPSRAILTEDDLARAVWPSAVGKAIAAHTSRLRLVRTTLVVEVEDATWQKQLYPLTSQILQRLRRVTGSEVVKEIEFRIGIPRRQPQRAEARSTAADEMRKPADEADQIQDPVLKRVYQMSRKKASA